MKSLWYLNKYLAKYKWRYLLGFFFILCSNVFNAYAPNFIKDIVNEVNDTIDAGDFSDPVIKVLVNSILTLAALYILFIFSKGVFVFLTRQTIIVASRMIEFDLKNEIYAKYQDLSLNYYKTQSTGDLMNRITEDVAKVRMYLGPGMMYPVNLVVLFVMCVFFMTRINVELTLYTLAPLPIMAVMIYFVSSRMNRQSERVQRKQSKLSTLVQENISGIRILKSFSGEERKINRFGEASEDYKKESMRLVKINGLFLPSIMLLIGISNVITIYVGGKMSADPTSGVHAGDIVGFIVYVNMLTWPFAAVGFITSIVQRAAASQERLNSFLKLENDLKPHKGKPVLFEKEISFDKVDFTYANSHQKALNEINLAIEKGKTTVIYGKTGSGKSTILQLIMRLYDIDAGKLTVDGVELSEIDLKKWREEIAYVPQDVFLFSDTIESNVAFSVDGDAAYEVEKATKLAAVHEDVGNLQEGYKTLLGERGVNLSGGQKQRLSIARAWITGADIIFFDDSLSAVDTDTEEQILNAIGREGEEKTVVVVSHRAGIAKFADKIYCLDEGRVIEEGTPDELIDGGGYFAEIYAKQQKDNSQ